MLVEVWVGLGLVGCCVWGGFWGGGVRRVMGV